MYGKATPFVAIQAVVRGRVQGVGFRYFAQRTATNLHVNGWVRNNGDGSVEVFAEGRETDVRAFEDALRDGPAYAHVTSVHTKRFPFQDLYDSFRVVY